MTSLRWTFGGSSGTGIGSPTDAAAVLMHSTYLSTRLLFLFCRIPTHLHISQSCSSSFEQRFTNIFPEILADNTLSFLSLVERFNKDGIWFPLISLLLYWISWAFLLCNFTISGQRRWWCEDWRKFVEIVSPHDGQEKTWWPKKNMMAKKKHDGQEKTWWPRKN